MTALKMKTPEESPFLLPRGSAPLGIKPARRPPSTTQPGCSHGPRTPPLWRPLPGGHAQPADPAHLLRAGLSPCGHDTRGGPRTPPPLPGRPGPSPPPAGGGQCAWRPLMQKQPGGRAFCPGGRSCFTTGASSPAAPELRPPGEEPGEVPWTAWLSGEHVPWERGDHRAPCRRLGVPLGGLPESPWPGKSRSGVELLKPLPGAVAQLFHHPGAPSRAQHQMGEKKCFLQKKITATTKKSCTIYLRICLKCSHHTHNRAQDVRLSAC